MSQSKSSNFTVCVNNFSFIFNLVYNFYILQDYCLRTIMPCIHLSLIINSFTHLFNKHLIVIIIMLGSTLGNEIQILEIWETTEGKQTITTEGSFEGNSTQNFVERSQETFLTAIPGTTLTLKISVEGLRRCKQIRYFIYKANFREFTTPVAKTWKVREIRKPKFTATAISMSNGNTKVNVIGSSWWALNAEEQKDSQF